MHDVLEEFVTNNDDKSYDFDDLKNFSIFLV